MSMLEYKALSQCILEHFATKKRDLVVIQRAVDLAEFSLRDMPRSTPAAKLKCPVPLVLGFFAELEQKRHFERQFEFPCPYDLIDDSDFQLCRDDVGRFSWETFYQRYAGCAGRISSTWPFVLDRDILMHVGMQSHGLMGGGGFFYYRVDDDGVIRFVSRYFTWIS